MHLTSTFHISAAQVPKTNSINQLYFLCRDSHALKIEICIYKSLPECGNEWVFPSLHPRFNRICDEFVTVLSLPFQALFHLSGITEFALGQEMLNLCQGGWLEFLSRDSFSNSIQESLALDSSWWQQFLPCWQLGPEVWHCQIN